MSNGATGTNYKITGNIGYDTPLRSLALDGSWVAAGGSWATPSYWKDADGVVHLQGMVTSGAANLIATLPAGYRPAGACRQAGVGNGLFCSLEVTAAGAVNITTTPVANVCLDGVSFRAA